MIFQEKDISQVFLILGLPLYFFVFGFVLIKMGRFLIGAPKQPWGLLAKGAGVILILSTMGVALYLFYWFWQVIRLKRSKWKIQEKSIF